MLRLEGERLMGFGALFLGVMFLYDFEIGLHTADSQQAYAILDLFPDLIGWILLFFGLRTLSSKAQGFEKIRWFPLYFIPLSILTILKGTLFCGAFYLADGGQNLAGTALDLCIHLLELGFLWLLFQKTAPLCRKKGEDKLASSHSLVPRIAVVEGVLYLISRAARLLPKGGSLAQGLAVVSKLDYLFLIFLVWYAAIALCRAMIRLTDEVKVRQR